MNLRTIYLSLLTVLLCQQLTAQTTFKKSYGGSGNERALCLEVLQDGSFVTCGYTTTNTNGQNDALLVKFNPDGSIAWSKQFGSTQYDYLAVVKRTADGGFIVTGTTYQNGNGDIFAAKLNAAGNIQWQRRFGAPGLMEEGQGVCILPDGYLFTGYSGTGTALNIYYIKTNFTGNFLWANTIASGGGIGGEPALTNSAEILIPAGYQGEGLFFRLNNTTGNIAGTLQLSGAGNEALYHVKNTGNGFIASDHSWVPSGNTQTWPWLVKLNPTGAVIWSKGYDLGISGRANAEATSDGGFVFGVYANTGPEAIIVKTDSLGEVQWAKSYAFPLGGTGFLYHVKQTPDGGYAAVGHCQIAGNGEDLFVLKTDSMGNIAGCCPLDMNATAYPYNPAQTNPVLTTAALNNNFSTAYLPANIALTAEDRCNGPICCITRSGTMQAASKLVCANETASFVHNGNQVLDSDDQFRFILFTSTGDTLGSIVATSATPDFVLAPPLLTNTVYYVAAVAGNSVAGNIDVNDPCLHISNAAQVIWRPTPAVTFGLANPAVCDGTCKTISAIFSGIAPFSLTYSSPAGTASQVFPGTSGTFQVCVPAGTPLGAWTVQAVSLNDAHCTCD